MDTSNEKNILINLQLLKWFQFYQVFDSSGTKIFGWNGHQLCFIVATVISLFLFCYGIAGFFFNNKCNIITNDLFLIFVVNTQVLLSIWKLFVYLNNRNKFLDLIKITQINFLKSDQCFNYHDKTITFTNYILIFEIVLILQWLIFPLVYNKFIVLENSDVVPRTLSTSVSTYPHKRLISILFYFT